MAKSARIRKVNLGPSERITAKNSLVGMNVIAHYSHPTTGQAMLVLERPDGAVLSQQAGTAKAPAAKKKAATAAKKATTIGIPPFAPKPSAATSFDPAALEASHGA